MKTNRLFLGMMLMVVAIVFAACESESEVSPKASSAVKEATTASAAPVPVKTDGFKEAPMLTKLVSAGTLKAVAERMPAKEDIMVETVTEEIGKYGGDWKMPWTGPNDRWAVGQPTEEAYVPFQKRRKHS